MELTVFRTHDNNGAGVVAQQQAGTVLEQSLEALVFFHMHEAKRTLTGNDVGF